MARPRTYQEAMDLALMAKGNIAEVEKNEFPKKKGKDEKEYFRRRVGPRLSQDFRSKRPRKELRIKYVKFV
jgi:hypothetical protein